MALQAKGGGAHPRPPSLSAVLILMLAVTTPLGLMAATTGVSPTITNLEFSVGPAQLGVPTGTPLGTATSYVFAEQFGPWVAGGPGDSADDDVYQAELTLPVPLPFRNALIVDDGFPTIPAVGTGVVPPPPVIPFPPPPGILPPPQCTIPTDQENINALAIESLTVTLPVSPEDVRLALLGGALFVQFSVDNAALGLGGTGVNIEATTVPAEHPGDVYESSPTSPLGTNVVIADEDASGLALPGPPQDDLDALILEQSIFDFPPFEDTDGDGTPDTPFFLFSCDKSFAGPVTTFLPGDILRPGPPGGPGVPAPEPFVQVAAAGLGLAPTDDLDALWIDNSANGVLFSLAAGSPTLATVNNLVTLGIGGVPGDILYVNLALPPVPVVVLGANEIGLQGTLYGDPQDDELNALWVTDAPLAAPLEVPVELSVFEAD